jgi:hypothetical protein
MVEGDGETERISAVAFESFCKMSKANGENKNVSMTHFIIICNTQHIHVRGVTIK